MGLGIIRQVEEMGRRQIRWDKFLFAKFHIVGITLVTGMGSEGDSVCVLHPINASSI